MKEWIVELRERERRRNLIDLAVRVACAELHVSPEHLVSRFGPSVTKSEVAKHFAKLGNDDHDRP
jgi:hypothetical protein